MKTKTSKLTVTAFFVALCAIMSQIAFPIPLSTVPFSLGIAAAFLTGALLPPAQATAALGVYIALGAAGIPVFSQLRGGLSVIIGPTGGFLLGYILIALIVSLISHGLKKTTFLKLFAVMVLALLMCYAIGLPWFMVVTGNSFSYAVSVCVYTFVLPDTLKAAISAYLAAAIKKNAQFKI